MENQTENQNPTKVAVTNRQKLTLAKVLAAGNNSKSRDLGVDIMALLTPNIEYSTDYVVLGYNVGKLDKKEKEPQKFWQNLELAEVDAFNFYKGQDNLVSCPTIKLKLPTVDYDPESDLKREAAENKRYDKDFIKNCRLVLETGVKNYTNGAQASIKGIALAVPTEAADV